MNIQWHKLIHTMLVTVLHVVNMVGINLANITFLLSSTRLTLEPDCSESGTSTTRLDLWTRFYQYHYTRTMVLTTLA